MINIFPAVSITADHAPLPIDFYRIILSEYGCSHTALGRTECDYSDGTVLFLAPGESVEIENTSTKKYILAFHPQIIPDTPLGLHFDDYTFFSYINNEALHISRREKIIFLRCLENISDELSRPADNHSRALITKSISLLLDYCKRFYDRQFILRSDENRHLIAKTEQIIYNYFRHNTSKTKGLPTTSYCAELLALSPAYFTDLLKNETGQTLGEFIEAKRIELAKLWLSEGDKTLAQIARGLGYSSTEYFSRLFEKLTGYKPGQYQIC